MLISQDMLRGELYSTTVKAARFVIHLILLLQFEHPFRLINSNTIS